MAGKRLTQAPKAGDVIWLSDGGTTGHEQAGRRPWLVVSESIYNAESALVFAAPITSTQTDWPYAVPLPEGEGSGISGFVLADQAKATDWRSRHARHAGRCPPGTLATVRLIIARILGL